MKNYLRLFLLAGFILVSGLRLSAQTVFINEIHYDNASTDAGEAIEIAGPAGTDLTGWSVVLYNGSGGASYGNVSLSGVIPNISNGFGFVQVLYGGIQNGSPDGIALVDASSTVIQFLSYEGTFMATDGPANGMTSTDIGVAEGSGTPVGYSLQLGGTGTVYTDFAWQTELAATFNAVNANQEFTGGSLKVVINEFVFNHTGTDIDEFAEIKSDPNTDLSGYTLLEIEGDGTGAGAVDKIFALGTTDVNGYWTTGMLSNAFENGTLTLLLVKNFSGALNDDLDTDNDGVLDVMPWDEIVDDVAVNDGGSSDVTYSSAVLTPDFDGSSFTVGGASRIPDGTDSDAASDWVRNDFDGQGLPDFPDALADNGEAINTPGAENEIAVVVEDISLIINEVDADNAGTDTEEFIELYDGGLGNKALDGYVVVLYNGGNDQSYAAYDLDGYSTNAEGYFVLGSSLVPNVDMVIGSTNIIQNGADAVALYKDDASNFPNGTTIILSNLEDALVYGTNDPVDVELLVLLNSGQPQVNDDTENSMQRIPNGSGGARNTSTYSTLIPTPGTENGVEPPTPETTTIAEARATSDGTVVAITGILTVSDQFAGAAYLQDTTAGIAVFDPKVHGEGIFMIGDSITISGTKTTYNGQIEINPVSSVVSYGPANYPIQPMEITLAEMSSHPSELVTVADAAFPIPGDLFFGNTNFELTDGSGTGEMRLDGDVVDLVGLAQPEVCEVTGVVGQYNDIYQLMPRMRSDLPCATEFTTDDGLGISKDATLDIVTWNIEWFGDEGNSPAGANADTVQKDSVKAVLNSLDADIYAVEEVSDDALFAEMVSEMNGYDYILSEYVSNPDQSGVKQKVGFIYKTSTVSVVETKPLLASVCTYYNGGDASALGDFPGGDATRFWASGRLPFMLVADVTINGATVRYNVIDIHARANSSSDALLRYEMRKYDVEVLKDSLDQYYSDANIVLVGDYNDDVDVTVADVPTTVTSYINYVDDPEDYSTVTGVLSDEGFRSYVFETDMIDHITLSNELFNEYIDGSARVHYEFYDSDYTKTASDHFPVSIRLQMQALELVSISSTEIDCAEGSNGTATVEVAGGIPPYSYLWSDGQTTATAENLSSGNYSVTVKDALGNEVSAEIELFDPAPIEVVLSDDQVVYPAYPDSACTTLSVMSVNGASGGYTYEWSDGESIIATTESVTVCPTEATMYYLTVTDEKDCSVTDSVLVSPVDVLCTTGEGMDKIQVCFHGKSMCVAYPAVDELLRNGAVLGACAPEENNLVEVVLENVRVYPNPFQNNFTIDFTSDNKADAQLVITTIEGTLVYSEVVSIHKGYNTLQMKLKELASGTYFVTITGSGVSRVSEMILKK